MHLFYIMLHNTFAYNPQKHKITKIISFYYILDNVCDSVQRPNLHLIYYKSVSKYSITHAW